MAYDQKPEKEVLQHEWERVWTAQDWISHQVELKRIEYQMQDCKAEWRLNDKVCPEILFQIKNGGMSKDQGVISPRYEENEFKLEKYKYWKEKNMTPIEREESNKRIQALMAEMISFKIKTVK